MPRKILGINSNSRTPSQLNQETYPTPINQTISPQSQMDRVRLGAMVNQEFHALWPYGTTFLSPMLPAPNMALPYALAAGGIPYPLPLYQPTAATPLNIAAPVPTVSLSASSNVTAGYSSSSSCASSPPTGQNNNDSGKMLIQIGLQCVNQNNPLNINSLNDMNLMNLIDQDARKVVSGESHSQRSSPVVLNGENELIGKSFSAAGGDASNADVVLSEAKCNDFIHLSLIGSEVSEKVAYGHRNRPCFKKIDSLCARTKQDLIRPDGVLPNINSQGIAWAVKDLIFVFTRLVNAWIIVKGYVYKTPDGLSKVKSSLSPEFARSFITWHDATRGFIDNIIQSIINLEILVQAQKNIYQKSDNNGTKSSSAASFSSTPIKLQQSNQSSATQNSTVTSNVFEDSTFDFLNSSNDSITVKTKENLNCNKKYMYTMVEDSEGSQRQATANGTYFKTGTYNPIKKDSAIVATGGVTNEPQESNNINFLEQFANATSLVDWTNSFETSLSELPTPTKMKMNEEIPLSNWINYNIRVLEKEDAQPLGRDLIDKLNVLIERVLNMKTADIFCKMQFCANYFPDFVAKNQTEFMDIRSIILKCQVGGYSHIFEVVHDIRKIIYKAKSYLETTQNSQLDKSIYAFEKEFNQILMEEPFENYQFDHINGEPKEILYHCRN